MSEIKEAVLKKYFYRIKTLEENIELYNKKVIKRIGYIINLEDYNELKAKIHYEKNDKKKNQNKGAPKDVDIKDDEKIITIKELEFKTNQYLTNMLLNGNKYIIIDATFFKVICEKGKENSKGIEYEINNNKAILSVKLNNKTIEFNNNKKDNILEESNLKTKQWNNFDLIKKAYQNIKTYYDFEIKFPNDIKAKKESKITDKGYLIEKEWLDNWKSQNQYENIKTEYLIQNKSEKEIKDKLIYTYEEKNYKLIDLSDIKNKELKDKQKIEEYLKKDSLVLVNSDFIKSFDQNHTLSEINYNLYENTIEIDLGSGNSLSFHSTDNIIPQNSGENASQVVNNTKSPSETQNNEDTLNAQNNIFVKDILTILLNFNLGEKEFLDKVENSKDNINNSINEYYLINANIFSQFIKFFELVKTVDIIEFYNLKSITDIKSDLLDKITKENKINVKKIAGLKDDFFKIFEIKKFFDIKPNKYQNNNDYKEYTYPSEFQIVSKNIKEKLCEIFQDQKYNNIDVISLGFITENIIFKPNKGRFFDLIKFFAYIFSLSTEENGVTKFTPEILISFNKKNSIVNNFPRIIKDETLIDTCIKKISDINEKYECKAVLINKENHKLFTKPPDNVIKVNKIDNKNQENNYISISIKLSEQYSKLEKLTKEKNNQIENDCYLISKKLIEGLEDILCFKEIDDIINKDNKLISEKQKLDKVITKIRQSNKRDKFKNKKKISRIR